MLPMKNRDHIVTALRDVLLCSFAVMLLTLVACDGGSDNGNDPVPDVTATDLLEVSAPEDVGNEEVIAAYPPEPYGTVAEATIDDFGFFDPSNKETIYLHEWYQHPEIKLLMLISTAAW